MSCDCGARVDELELEVQRLENTGRETLLFAAEAIIRLGALLGVELDPETRMWSPLDAEEVCEFGEDSPVSWVDPLVEGT